MQYNFDWGGALNKTKGLLNNAKNTFTGFARGITAAPGQPGSYLPKPPSLPVYHPNNSPLLFGGSSPSKGLLASNTPRVGVSSPAALKSAGILPKPAIKSVTTTYHPPTTGTTAGQ